MPSSSIDDILSRIGIDPTYPDLDDLRALVGFVLELGATEDEVVAAAPAGRIGSLGLDLSIRPPGRTVSLDTFAAESGDDAALVHRLWHAFGLSDAGDVPSPVTPDAADAVRVMALLAHGVGEESALGFARVVGASTAQLADALSSLTRVGVEVPQRDSGTPYSEVVREYCSLAKELLPTLWDSIAAVFRRHLVLFSNQQWAIDASGVAVTHDRTIGFVDLVGSTEVLRNLSVAELAQRVDLFEQLVWDVVVAAGGRVVKLIGDEAMFVVTDPDAGCRLAVELVERSPHPVRVGIAHGAVVALRGDYYGPTVNLAARLVAVATPEAVVASESVQQALEDGQFVFDSYPTGPLRGFPDVTTAYRVGRPTHV